MIKALLAPSSVSSCCDPAPDLATIPPARSFRRRAFGVVLLLAFGGAAPAIAADRIATRFEMFGLFGLHVLTLHTALDEIADRYVITVDYATTGLAGPTGGTDENPVGTAYVSLAHAGGTEAIRWGWIGTRYEIMSRTAKLALNMVRLRLMKS